MWNRQYWGDHYFARHYWDKIASQQGVAPPVVSGRSNQLLTLVGVGSSIILAIFSAMRLW